MADGREITLLTTPDYFSFSSPFLPSHRMWVSSREISSIVLTTYNIWLHETRVGWSHLAPSRHQCNIITTFCNKNEIWYKCQVSSSVYRNEIVIISDFLLPIIISHIIVVVVCNAVYDNFHFTISSSDRVSCMEITKACQATITPMCWYRHRHHLSLFLFEGNEEDLVLKVIRMEDQE